MKEIPLTKGKVALVDDEDFDWLNQWNWQAMYDGWNWYARRNEGINPFRKKIYMHRFIMDAHDGVKVDHADGNGLHNFRSNLRVCTPLENSRNARMRKDNTSGFRGVRWHKLRNKYEVTIKVSAKRISLGYFSDAEQAARAYDEAAKKHHGPFAHLNFPEAR